MLPVLEERRVPRLVVIPGHAHPDCGFDSDRHRIDERATVCADRLGYGQTGRHHCGTGMQHRGKMGVVEVERVGEHSVGKRRPGSRHLRCQANHRRLTRSALTGDEIDHRLRRVQLGGGDRDPQDIENPELNAGRNILRCR